MDKIPSPAPASVRYRAVFISPHLDDAVFSCGGRIAQLVKEGPVLVLNLFTRYLADLKIHGAVMGAQRHQEERDAAEFLGFESRSLGELDAPFRRKAYRKLGNLFHPPCQQDLDWLPGLRAKLFGMLSEIEFETLYVPLGIGWHVDHVLTYLAFESWPGKWPLQYYEDAPYCCIPHATRYRLNDIATYPRHPDDISLREVHPLLAWWQAASAYTNTALMKNLQPWMIRKLAVPSVSYYLWRLMWHHCRSDASTNQPGLCPVIVAISDQFECKVDAMVLYSSQFGEFFTSRPDCIASSMSYVRALGESAAAERYWFDATSS
jgi:LmbE family N-acetylglucosaminyl deacetylase